jgi:hypothetical protein
MVTFKNMPQSRAAQSAAGSRNEGMPNAAQATADDIRKQCPAALLPAFEALIALICREAGKCQETAWPKQKILSFGVGPKKMSQHHCYLALYTEHINLGFYHGTSLPDPSNLLQGIGKGLRHIKVKSAVEASNPAIVQLVRAAVANRVAHSAEG